MKKFVALTVLMAVATISLAQEKSMDAFIDKLMSKMTVKEKIGQLNLLPSGVIQTGISDNSPVMELIASGQLGGVLNVRGVKEVRELQEAVVKKSRLGIPLIFGLDVIHGYETIFPIPLALSCSWDLPAIERVARIAAVEATADGICWTYSPMVDIALDARWGRIAEGSGEDPYLGSRIAEVIVRGYQGRGERFATDELMACVKHFALYGAAEAGRDYNTVDMSHTRMYNQYFPPYKAAVEAGAGSVMTSFNIVDFVPATANRWLVDDVLRKEWKFGGFVVTDYGSIGEMVSHGMGDLQTSSDLALLAGTDMDMCSEAFTKTLEQSLNEGRITMGDIDRACRRMLEAKYKLGLFDDPYRYCDASRRAKDIYTAEHRNVARNLAAETFVLLKNDDGLLPLKKQGRIALIGPLADNVVTVGSWAPTATYKHPTLRQAMESALKGKAEVLYAQGCNFFGDSILQSNAHFGRPTPWIDAEVLKREAMAVADKADVIVLAMGEEQEQSGECSSRSDLETPQVQRDLMAALLTLGKPVVLLNYAGRPTVLTWESEHIPAIMNVWFGGTEGADAICDVLFGDKVPCGRLTVSMPRNTGQEPLYYNYLPTGRPTGEDAKKFRKFSSNYLDVVNDPLYPFGFGLSYTTFEYGDISLSSQKMTAGGSLTATIRVTNTGTREADEVVQLYIHDIAASITRPVKELKGFERIRLKPGESREVSFTITPDLLKFYRPSSSSMNTMDHVLEPGDFEVMIGPDSRLKQLKKAVFTVK